MTQQENNALDKDADTEDETSPKSDKDSHGTGGAAGSYGGPVDAVKDSYATSTEIMDNDS